MTNAQLIEILQKLPQDADVYLAQDEFGYYYTFDEVSLCNVGGEMYDKQNPYQAWDTGKHIKGIVIGKP